MLTFAQYSSIHKLEIHTSKSAVSKAIKDLRKETKTVGFVPTMGALHAGHMSLIKIAAELTDIVVCSIFVNPTQFTNPTDLEKYPRPIEADLALLKTSSCQVLFLPEVSEIYPEKENWNFELNYLENILEGKFRPGHYQGVTQVVKKLLDIVEPDFMFLGQKDYQQVMVLDYMTSTLELPVEVVMCPIVREDDGLALSSRNIHLSASDREKAAVLSRTLFGAKKDFERKTLSELKEEAWITLNTVDGVTPEYFEICDARTLLPAQSKECLSLVALVAASVGQTRLIDNIILK